jgi:hypothetical protein
MADAGYTDDPTIPDQAELFRRIPPCHFVPDQNSGGLRPSSAAFNDHPNGSPMSVVLADVLAAMGRRPDDVLAGHIGFALAKITAGFARECQQGVAREPLEDEPAHAVVFGRKTKAVMRKLATEAHWVIPPPRP